VKTRLSILSVVAALISHSAIAQTVTLVPSDPKRWDSSVSIGWLGGDKSDIAESWNDWYDTFATSVDVGRYFTPHIKTELGATFTSTGEVYSTDQFVVPTLPSPVFFSREHRFSVNALNVAAAYQWFDNTWVHPFVGAGVQLAWERHRVETPFPTAFTRDGRGPITVPPVAAESETRFDPRPFLSGGAKFYVSEQGFIRTDLAAAFDGHGATRVTWRIGGGIDF